ncbi:BTAD domain-containing putative transcriptional regulator [Kribbella sp. NPDC023855]|uniref:BTAD domain-containing putative transcriptional regulator n=1 Tax=Kribbella sp. NPDC023855 TaxID=3154698 RepID=UPI0033E422BC
MGSVRYELLGPLVVRRDRIRRNLGPEQQQRILAALLLKANQAVSPAELVAAAWEATPPEDARELVAGHIDALRELVDPHRTPGSGELLITLGDGKYVLCVMPAESDLSEFTLYVAEAERLSAAGQDREAADKVRTALALWHGTPLEGLTGHPFDEIRPQLLAARSNAEETLRTLETELAHPGFPAHSTTPQPSGHPHSPMPATPQAPGHPHSPMPATPQAPGHPHSPMPATPQLPGRTSSTTPLAPHLPGRTHSAPPPTPQVSGRAGEGRPYSAPLGSTPPPPVPPAPTRWKLVVLKLLGAATPLVTFGFGGWVLMGVVAIRQRSIALGLSAVGYLAAMLGYFFLVIEPDQPEFTDRDFMISLIQLFAAIACSVQAAVVIGRPPRRKPQQPPYLLPQHQLPPAQHPPAYPPQPAYPPSAYQPPVLSADAVLRNNARQIVANEPALAQALRIGRPDLPRHFDDGGLVDLNGAPAAVLETLPGVTGEHAAAIMLSRTQYGRFRVVEELWSRGLLPAHLAPQLTDRLVILNVQDT